MKETLQLIALKVEEGSVGGRKLSPNKPYYFIDGFDIIDDTYLKVRKDRTNEVNIYEDYFKGESAYPSVHISAIVGENGSGKSTVVEFLMRIINNFAATSIGEYSPNQRTNEHLHYVDGVKGSLYFRKDDTIWEIRVRNRNVQLIDYSPNGYDGEWYEFIYNGLSAYWDNEESDSPIEDKERSPFERWKNKNQSLEDIYKALFYTYISNYSIYAYNTSDYREESNNVTYERKCRRLGSQNKRLDNDDCNWLHGLFHKNDGYQCPIVLSPYRDNGNIDINSENHLSKERLLSLLVSSPNGFSVLNGHLKAVRFSMSKRKDIFDAAYLKRGKDEDKLYHKLDSKGWAKLRNMVPKLWAVMYGIDLDKYKTERRHYDYALDYLTYKTLKISAQYSQYQQFHNYHVNKRNSIDEKLLESLVRKLSVDHSHITKKIRQTLAYLVYGIYEQQSDLETFEVDIQSMASGRIAEIMEIEKGKTNSPLNHRIVYSFDDLVPPPIYETDIKLKEIVEEGNKEVPFETLSSGEKQQVYTISSTLYHLSNIESIFDDENNERITYTHCNIILEELELYFHPELQKNLVKYLLDGVRQMHFKRLKAINVCMVTHSPFILSDIQSKNILALEKAGSTKSGLCTFGANIHDLLKTSFLHDSVIGDYAQWIINRIVVLMQVYQSMQNKKWRHKITREYWFLKPYLQYSADKKRGKCISFNGDLIKKDFPKEYIYERILVIDEPIVRAALIDEYKNVFGDLNATEEIAALTKRLEELKQLSAEA